MAKLFSKIWVSIFCICFINICSAQAELFIKSIEDQRPLAYASVANLTKGKMFFSNEQGFVSGDFEAGDSVFISFVGFQNLKARIDNLPQTFSLKQSAALLEPVKIENCKENIKHLFQSNIRKSIKVWRYR